MTRPLVVSMALLGVISLWGCGSQKSSPTEPSSPSQPPQTIPGTAEKPAIVSIDIPERTATLSFRAVANSPRYVIEVGTSPGGSEFTTATLQEGAPAGTTFTHTFTDLPAGFLYVRAKAQNSAGTGPASEDLRFLLQDMKYVREALFLQTGPYGGPGNHVVRGFRAGTHVTIRVSTSVTATQRQGIESIVSQLGETGAPLSASIVTMDSNRALCVRNEIHVVTIDNACGTGAGCINTCPPATLTTPWETASVFLGTPGQSGDNADMAAHEIGHALLGLYHLAYLGVDERPSHPAFFGTPEFPHALMFWQHTIGANVHQARLSNLEMRAVQAVFRAGISAGATRDDLVARGLIY